MIFGTSPKRSSPRSPTLKRSTSQPLKTSTSQMFARRFRLRSDKLEWAAAPKTESTAEKECRSAPSVAHTVPRPSSIELNQQQCPPVPQTPSLRTAQHLRLKPFESARNLLRRHKHKRPHTNPQQQAAGQSNHRPRPAQRILKALSKARSAQRFLSKLNCFKSQQESDTDSDTGDDADYSDVASTNELSFSDLDISQEPIGSGSCGAVFAATLKATTSSEHSSPACSHRTPACDMVVKQVAKSAAVFLDQEFRVMSSVSHPSIPRVFAMFRHPNNTHHLMAMERIRGPDLEHYICRYGVLSEKDALQIMLQTLSALVLLHRTGVAHMDIKPGNIMVRDFVGRRSATSPLRTENKSRLSAVLVDFGLSVTCPHPLMMSRKVYGEARGTPLYAAPEIGTGKPYALEKADVWSCGISLYEMVTGAVPYEPNGDITGFQQVSDLIQQTGHISQLYSHTDSSSCSRAPPPTGIRVLLESLLCLSPDQRPTAKQALHMVWKLKNGIAEFERGVT